MVPQLTFQCKFPHQLPPSPTSFYLVPDSINQKFNLNKFSKNLNELSIQSSFQNLLTFLNFQLYGQCFKGSLPSWPYPNFTIFPSYVFSLFQSTRRQNTFHYSHLKHSLPMVCKSPPKHHFICYPNQIPYQRKRLYQYD